MFRLFVTITNKFSIKNYCEFTLLFASLELCTIFASLFDNKVKLVMFSEILNNHDLLEKIDKNLVEFENMIVCYQVLKSLYIICYTEW